MLENVQRLSLQGELGASSADSTSSRLHPAIGEYQVVFNNAPLGLTLSSNRRKQAEVIRIKTDGNAEKAGVQVGDILCQVDRFNVEQYEEAMKILPGCVYPLLLRFRRESRALTSSASSSALLSLPHSQQPAHILRNNLKSRAITSLLDRQDEDDNKPSILDMPTPIRFANPSSSNTTIFFPPQPSLQTSKSYQDNTSEYLINSLEASRSQDSINAASSFPPSLSSSLNGSVHSKSLEFDIVLHEEVSNSFNAL